MMVDDKNPALAAVYLVSQGKLEQCEVHGGIYDGGFWGLEADFWRFAMADRYRGDCGPIPWAAEPEAREFTNLIKEAYEEYRGDCCAYCAKKLSVLSLAPLTNPDSMDAP
ncbi:hypothetical protein OEZ71_16235 [Defluviimonas sp. WL0050]|uniref:Uncharacterized protein n=1 Tax=Albidovulum litorale TaxID=2984134 RepID=A0ABT2ZRS9_9RHOB|nr:hypothetical protein [Defluviimonas sp. WL0050]MCV2873848.1 hypothetical protein [Defluviimonas sp. WL0050]